MNSEKRFASVRSQNPAKRYMWEYIDLRNRRDALLEELERTREASLRATSRLTATRLSGTSGHGGFENNAIRYVDCEAVLQKHIDQIGRCLEERLDMIDRLPDEKERTLMTYRYINGCSWDTIMNVMHYQRTQLWEIHGGALGKINRWIKERTSGT